MENDTNTMSLAIPEVVNKGIFGGGADSTNPSTVSTPAGPSQALKDFSIQAARTPSVSNRVSVDQIESQRTPLTLPDRQEPERLDISGQLASIKSQAQAVQQKLNERKQQTPTEIESREQTRNNLGSQLFSAIQGQADVADFTEALQDSVDFQRKQELKTDIDNKLMAKQREYDLALRDNRDQFGTRAQKAARAEEISTRYNRKLADLSIIQMARAGEFNDAKSYVDEKVRLELASRQSRIQGLQFLYDENKERLNKIDERAFAERIKKEEREYQEEYNKRKQLEDLKANLTINASEYGAGNFELERIQGAETIADLMSLPNASTYLTPKAERDLQQTKLNAARVMKSAGGSTGNPQTDVLVEAGVLGTEADPMLAKLAATQGGRLLTQSEVEPLTNSMRVIDGLNDLGNAIGSTNTDPIIGFFRSMNPYDLKASEIDAAITQLVPQLARGTYGEVGVLTDSDMARYSATLPNLTSTEAQNKAIMALTLRKVRSGFVSQLSAMESAGRDVSGFVDDYQAINNEIDRLEREIGVGATAEADFDAEFEEFSSQSTEEKPGFFKRVGRFLFGE